ncbi:MAG TPA: M14 family metallopeptidase [Acidimicrobiia bacterium]
MMDIRLPGSYVEGADRFRTAADKAGAVIERHALSLFGPDGEQLAVDVARLGPDAADAALLVISGTHGVEGFAGSACQVGWLEHGGAERAAVAGIVVVLVHALNPYGFAWIRRVNEDNVDLNRNGVDFDGPLPENPGYEELADALVPERWDQETQDVTTERILDYAGRHGFPALQAAISGGQYRHPAGLFYGGRAPSWSHGVLRDVAARHLARAGHVAAVDLHTGLGPFGVGELLGPRPGTPAWERARAWYGELTAPGEADSVSAAISGDVLDVLERWLSDAAEYTGIAIEWGTVDIVEVLQALRADAWLHAYGDPTGADAPAIKAALRAAFAPDDDDWTRLVGVRFEQVVGQAVAGLLG